MTQTGPITFESCPVQSVRWHECAEIFPWIEGAIREELKADIAKHGVLEPIVFLDGAILDGRNRYIIARELSIEYPRCEYIGNDPLGFVVSLNLKRRHLNESQRSMVAKRLETMKHGDNQFTRGDANLHLLRADAAKVMGVSERTVAYAGKVQDFGSAELIRSVDEGKTAVSTAADISTLPKEQQAEIVAKGEKEILAAAKAIRAEKAIVRRTERLDKLAEISKGNVALKTDRKFPIIYADPPWRYENPPIGASNRSIENHYPTMTLEEICALPVAELATNDALLYLWATAPKLAECQQVIEAWGFEYRTNLVWDKEIIGMGYHARNQHEILLVAKRGNIPPPAAGTQPSSVHRERRTDHSAKPSFYYEMIEAAYPQLPKIELFSRSPRAGWDAWGNQASAA